MQAAHRAGGTTLVTVAVRRVDITRQSASLLDFIDTTAIALLPNTAGCYTAADAIRTAHLGREAGLSHWVKLEVIGDEATLFPDTAALVEATRHLVKDGFVVLPYTNDDPDRVPQARRRRRRRRDAGRRADRLGPRHPEPHQPAHHQGTGPRAGHRRRWRGHGLGCGDRDGARRRRACCSTRPSPGPATRSPWPRAMKHAVIAGRLAYLAGRIPQRLYASASSPLDGMVGR